MTRLPPSASIAHKGDGPKLCAPSAIRNTPAIVACLDSVAPQSGRALEIASGTGQHITALAAAIPGLHWHPSEIAQDRIDSINAYAQDASLDNLHPARLLDATTPDWAATHTPYDLIYLGNLLHLITDEAASAVLIETAKAITPAGVFVIYGPFRRAGQLISDADAVFDSELRAADPDIGYKDDGWVIQMLTQAGLGDTVTSDMPANNLAFIARPEIS
ncbi:DUF938 domain-containing protein [Sulfitobacter sp. F26169L]|uniref:DUF938 domain-containing protein n=1 Tax=Sulfitobacter sp. F26169L TaxID=2996015 RepID=UPI002260A433|nr:DUF938 domain-containing protein [Sulfitobacter sp. F26169L]MCX7567351.1 DUF938 domain-containing protein [Sulfitobacter sp. F26169L]